MTKSYNLQSATVFTVCLLFVFANCQASMTISDAKQPPVSSPNIQAVHTPTQISAPTVATPSVSTTSTTTTRPTGATTPAPVTADNQTSTDSANSTNKRPIHTLIGTHLQSPQQEPVTYFMNSFNAAAKNPNAKHIVYQGYPRRIYLNDKGNLTHPYQVSNGSPLDVQPSSYVQIEIYKVVLYNESIVERMDRVHDSYCNQTQTEETLARMDECVPKYKESWIVKCQSKVYGNNWTYTDKQKMICFNRAEFRRKWRRCIFDDFDSLLKTRNEERLLYKVLRNEEPTFGTPSSIFRQFESIREKRLKLLECEEKVLGLNRQESA